MVAMKLKSGGGRTRKRATAGKKPATTRKPRAAAKVVATRRARTRGPAPRGAAGLNASDLMAFVATADSTRARDFYGSVMGLRLVADEPYALVFDANGVMLRVQKVDRVSPAGYTALGWSVADIARTIESLRAKGVHFE